MLVNQCRDGPNTYWISPRISFPGHIRTVDYEQACRGRAGLKMVWTVYKGAVVPGARKRVKL
jgi:hypothetical protein